MKKICAVLFMLSSIYSFSQTEETKDNPANAIIKKAIENRKSNLEKSAKYEADFYSHGVLRIKDIPTKILGQDLGEIGGAPKASENRIIYLAETFSKIKYQNPGKLKEHITASKISGEDKGLGFNNAETAEFNFYNNYIPFEVNVPSPIGDNAFTYYNYELEDTFTDKNNHVVYKIKVSPKSQNEPAMVGHVFIVDNSWELYAVNLSINGSQIRQQLLDILSINQTFSYNEKHKVWSKTVQHLVFDAGLFGVLVSGNFSYIYSNYNFNPDFNKKTFNNEIVSYEKDADKKPDAYWNSRRPIPLTTEERKDYISKDSIATLEKSKPYLDSIDDTKNKFKWISPILGHTYHNSYENWNIKYFGIIKKLGFNTVQAYHLAPSFYFTKTNPDTKTYTTIGTDLNYGFAEKRFRAAGTISHKFNNFSKRTLTLTGGSTIEQFNPENPINRIVNSISTLFFRDNYMKLYDHNFLRLKYDEEITNGIQLYSSIEYTRRRPLFNNTNFSTLKDLYKPYLSNNPLLPYDNETPAFLKHHLIKASVVTQINFGQKYWTRPDGKVNIPNPKYPVLFLKYEKGFAASNDNYNFDHISSRIAYDLTITDKGELGINLQAGKFFNAENIAFVDFKHFNGNQTHVGKSQRYLNVFNLLPYYTHSTNNQYFAGHAEHNFKGYLTNKIPLLNKLNYHVVAGYHVLSIPEQKPYQEFTLGLDNVGWSKFRFLRIDYVRSYQSGFATHGVIFGITFLDILE